jgi:uncharacterized membrane protein
MRNRPKGRRPWWVVLFLSLFVAGYGAMFVARGEGGFQEPFATAYRKVPWGILGHAVFGTLVLLTGPLQFRRDLLARRRTLHRVGGRLYVLGSLGTGATGLFMAARSYGGIGTHVAFGLLAVLVLVTTSVGFARILAGDVASHREWMLRSFALIFAGVMLRLELPVLVATSGWEFERCYQVIAWVSWVPNLLWAEWRVRRARRPVRPASRVAFRVDPTIGLLPAVPKPGD